MTVKADKTRNLVAKYARRFNKAGGIESKKDKQRRGKVKNLRRYLEDSVNEYLELRDDT